MIQVYSIVLWANPYEMSLEEAAEKCYCLLSALSMYGEELMPKYLSARRKRDVKDFVLTLQNVQELIEKNVNKESNKVFYELGSSMSFFSSFDEGQSCRISIKISRCLNSNITNTLVIKLPYEHFSGLDERRADFEKLFKELVCIFNPYYGFVENNQNQQIDEYYWRNDKPTFLHWMNYFSTETMCKIGMDKLGYLLGYEKMPNGYFYKLQESAIDINRRSHLLRQKEITNLLGL